VPLARRLIDAGASSKAQRQASAPMAAGGPGAAAWGAKRAEMSFFLEEARRRRSSREQNSRRITALYAAARMSGKATPSRLLLDERRRANLPARSGVTGVRRAGRLQGGKSA